MFPTNLHKSLETSPPGLQVHIMTGFQLLRAGVRCTDRWFEVISAYHFKRLNHSLGFTFAQW